MKRLSPKEAQKLLEDMKVDIPLPKAAVTRNRQNMALDMAIKALNCVELFGISEQLDGEYDPRQDIYYLAEKIGIHRLYALVVQLRGEPESCIDTIGRQAAIDALRVAYWDDNIQSAKDDPCIVDAMTDWAIRQVKALPSAQPERKKGKWIYNSPVTMKCDQCGLVIKDWDWNRFKFCPNCDCDMRGEQE